MVYIIEEEIYSDSDNSSVYTSEDEFEEDKHLHTKMQDEIDVYKEEEAEREKERKYQLTKKPELTEK